MSNELDLQDKTRMLDVYKDITEIIDKISNLKVFPPLVWVWAWDVTKDLYESFQDGSQGLEYGVTVDEDELWALFWEQADTNGFSLEYGSEDLYEHIRDWLFDVHAVEEVEFEDEEEDEEDES
jgi:hypothetical protein